VKMENTSNKEDDRMLKMRKAIQDVNKNSNLTPQQKAKRIQLIMSGKEDIVEDIKIEEKKK